MRRHEMKVISALPQDYYPTPRELAIKMLDGINLKEVRTALEPSAGSADLADVLVRMHEAGRNKYKHNGPTLDLDCIELDEGLRTVLKGKGFKVVHDDFLTFNTTKRYDLILMNPPFSEGDKHLFKALMMQKDGGQIVCLLNAETLRNPYTVLRRELLKWLTHYGENVSVEYLSNQFTQADRKTDVEIALVKITIPEAEAKGILLDNLIKAQEAVEEDGGDENNKVAHYDFIKAIVAQFDAETRACIALVREYKALCPHILTCYNKEKNPYAKAVLTLKIEDVPSYEENIDTNQLIRRIRMKYWAELFSRPEFTSCLTSAMQKNYRGQVERLADYDFSVFNIGEINREMMLNVVTGIEEAIMTLFDKLSADHSWYPETKNNVHYWNGWAGNKAHRVAEKVIIPIHGAFADISWSKQAFRTHDVNEVLWDIEKTFNYLDNGETKTQFNMCSYVEYCSNIGQTKKIPLKYFTIDLFKKGTCHIRFTNKRLLEKFNVFCALRKEKWLPPNYGRAKYEDMTEMQKKAVDGFQGKLAYHDVYTEPAYYLAGITGDNVKKLGQTTEEGE
jgi:hypothetical protein